MKIVQSKPAFTTLAVALTVASLALIGCNNTGKAAATPANFTIGINNHYLDHPSCLFTDTRFPFETSDPEKTKQMDKIGRAHV